jgi:hypothetical protein
MKFFMLEPEVAGGLGEQTDIDSSAHPPVVTRLEYRFEGWLGDDILESFPCYIVTERLKEALAALPPTGCAFDSVLVSKSEVFEELYPNRALPKFFWLKVTGRAGVDDFGLSAAYQLIVSERCLRRMEQFNLADCTVEEWHAPAT